MGCCPCCGQKVPEEEKIITRFESQLGYGRSKAQQVVDETRKLATDGITSKPQLDEIDLSLRLNLNRLDATVKEKFLDNFKKEGGYDNGQLILLGLALSKGPLKAKVQILWDYMDHKNAGKVTETEFANVVTQLMKISVSHTQILVSASNKSGEYDHIKQFYARLNDYITPAIKKLTGEIYHDKTELGMEAMNQEFVNNRTLDNILSTRGLRIYVTQVHDETPIKEKGNTVAVLDAFAAFQ